MITIISQHLNLLVSLSIVLGAIGVIIHWHFYSKDDVDSKISGAKLAFKDMLDELSNDILNISTCINKIKEEVKDEQKEMVVKFLEDFQELENRFRAALDKKANKEALERLEAKLDAKSEKSDVLRLETKIEKLYDAVIQIKTIAFKNEEGN